MGEDNIVSLAGVRSVQRSDRHKVAAKALVARSLGLIVRDISMGSFSMTEEPGTGALLFLMPKTPTAKPQPLRPAPTYSLLALECARHATAMMLERADDGDMGVAEDYDSDDMEGEKARQLASAKFTDEKRQCRFIRETFADTAEFLVRNWSIVEKLAAKLDGGSILAEEIPSLRWPKAVAK